MSAHLAPQLKNSGAMGSTAGLRSNVAHLETGRVEVAKCRPDGRFWFSGWARSSLKHAKADYAVLGWQGRDHSFHLFTAIPTGAVRADLAKLYGPDSRKAGFLQEIEISDLPPPDVTIQGWAVDWEAQQAFPMEGGVRFDRPVPYPETG